RFAPAPVRRSPTASGVRRPAAGRRRPPRAPMLMLLLVLVALAGALDLIRLRGLRRSLAAVFGGELALPLAEAFSEAHQLLLFEELLGAGKHLLLLLVRMVLNQVLQHLRLGGEFRRPAP